MRSFFRRLWYLVGQRRGDTDLAEELAFHQLMKQQEFESDGRDSAAAAFAARRALGNMTLAREDARAVWIWLWLESVWQDGVYVFRTFRRHPGFVVAALLTLSLGIGANTAVFSVVNAILIRPAPYPDPSRLVIFGYTFQGTWAPWSSPAKFEVWRRHSEALQDLSAVRFRHVTLTVGPEAEQIPAGQVNAAFFHLFGASFVNGRAFTADEDRPGAGHVVILGYGLWQRWFSGDLGVLGTSVRLDGTNAIVVGILAPSFDTTIFSASPDVWLPLQLDPHRVDHPPSLRAAARLKPGVSLEMANAEAGLAGGEFRGTFPEAAGPNDTFALAPFQDTLVNKLRPSLLVLLGAVSLVLLIAGANVANLLLVRASVRQHELAIRAAIGASRGRIVRQLVTEGVVLSLMGGVLGLAVGTSGVRTLLHWYPGDLPRIGAHGAGLGTDWRVLAFTLVVSLTTGLVFGVLPAFQVSRRAPRWWLTEGGVGGSGTRRGAQTLRSVLMATELGLAIVLLIGAALLVRTFIALGEANRGFNAHDVLTMRMALTDRRFAETSRVVRLVEDGVQRVRALPGVADVGVATSLPLESDWLTSFLVLGSSAGRVPRLASYRIVSPDYFTALQIPVIRGRAFTDRDAEGAPLVALINETLARQLWPSKDAINDQITLFPGVRPDNDPVRAIVGVVRDVRDGLVLNRESRPTVYVPMAQMPNRQLQAEPLVWFIRRQPDSYTPSATISKALQQVSGGVSLAQIRSMDTVSVEATARTRFQMVLMAIFGGSALLLAAVGVYGVMAYTVRQRTHEIGVRLALGADPRAVRYMVIRQSLGVTLPGVVVGIAAAFGFARVLDGLLFGVTVHDPLVFVCVPLFLTAVTLVAVWRPSQLASHIDPAVALRRS